jgi:hypothetical protein
MTPIDLSLLFTGCGPLPAITHVEEQSGPWDHVGVHRKPQFADGGTAMERMTHYLCPGGLRRSAGVRPRTVGGRFGAGRCRRRPAHFLIDEARRRPRSATLRKELP